MFLSAILEVLPIVQDSASFGPAAYVPTTRKRKQKGKRRR